MSVSYAVKNPIVPKVRKNIAVIAQELQALQRQRAVVIKSRIMQANRLQAIVAGTLGYSSGMDEKSRLKKMSEASAIIKEVSAGETDSPMKAIILTTLVGIEAFETMQKALEKEMLKVAEKLPIAKWVSQSNQKGFGLLSLAIVIGETGDLANYANPGKVWRRLGCAPYTKDGKTLMGATWRSGKEGKLHAIDWEEFGYSPRRRSIAYVIGENLLKQNGEGPYRTRYNESKERSMENHPEYGPKPGRHHNHGMLLMTKLLLKNLWIEWNR